jgi:mannose-6-phosphate isomerase-like protein (cupin superfamily)
MEYNSNIYVTISHNACVTLNLGDNHRTSNDGSICIIEYTSTEEIPQEVQDVLIESLTHQQALEMVSTEEWTSQLPV